MGKRNYSGLVINLVGPHPWHCKSLTNSSTPLFPSPGPDSTAMHGLLSQETKRTPGKEDEKKITQNKSHLPRGLCRNASLPPAAWPRFTFEPFLLYNSLFSPAEGPPAPQAASTGARRRRRLSAFPADAKGSRGPGAARPRGGRQGAAGGPGRRAARQARPPRGHSELPAAVGAPRPARPRRRARTPARGPGPGPPARLPETSPRGAPGQEPSRRPPPCFQT